MKLISLNEKSYETLFFFLIFFGLSISILIKEINILILPTTDLKIIHIYRALIILSAILLFLSREKKINYSCLLLVILNIFFIYNSYLSEALVFSVEQSEIFNKFSTHVSPETHVNMQEEKFKFLIINFFNIFIPLLVLSTTKMKFDLEYFKKISLKFLNIFSIILLIFFSAKYVYHYKIEYVEGFSIKQYFINLHSLIYILNIHILLIIEKLLEKKINIKLGLFYILIIFLSFFITSSLSHYLISILTILYLSINVIKSLKNNFFYLLSLFLVIFTIIFTYFIIDNFNTDNLNFIEGSILIRLIQIYYFFEYSTNLNFFVGNDILVKDIISLPHNSIIDVFLCTGILGLMLFFLIIYKSLKNIHKYNIYRNFIFIIFLQSFLFSNLSGFIFTNIILNISLACLFKFNVNRVEIN